MTISLARQQLSQALAEQSHMKLKQLLQGNRSCCKIGIKDTVPVWHAPRVLANVVSVNQGLARCIILCIQQG